MASARSRPGSRYNWGACAPPSRLGICWAVLLTAGIGLDAQWLTLKTPRLPRCPDGKPNLDAPAPRTPDGKPHFSGLWKNDGGDRYYNNIAVSRAHENACRRRREPRRRRVDSD